MPPWLRWVFGLAIAALVTVPPYFHFRSVYAYQKRLREVTPGVLVRCGQLTAEGFRDAIREHRIRTVINLQDEYPDPDLDRSYFRRGTVKESELCKRLGVRYVYIAPDLIPRRMVPEHRPAAIDRFLEVMDDPANYPVLIHCRAGLHRTGAMVAVYQMEYLGWGKRDAIDDLKRNGYAEWPCTAANDYITQYVLSYRRGVRVPAESRPGAEPVAANR